MVELSVVTITYNEKDNIRLFIETVHRILKENNISGEIVVVDDNSPDGTSEVVEELKKKYPATVLIKRPGKLGIGSAYYTGYQAAQGKIIALLDADLSHSPDHLPEFYALAKENKIVYGSRYLGETKFETDFAHRCGTRLLNGWVSMMLGTKMKDHTNGYLVFPKQAMEQIIEYGRPRKLFPFEHILYGITVAAIARKLNIATVERKTPYHQRVHGETKIPFWWGIKVVFGDMWYSVKVRRRLR